MALGRAQTVRAERALPCPSPKGTRRRKACLIALAASKMKHSRAAKEKGLGGAEGKNLRDTERPKPVKPTGQAACILEAVHPPRRPRLSPTLTKSTHSVQLPVRIPGVPEIPFTPVRG